MKYPYLPVAILFLQACNPTNDPGVDASPDSRADGRVDIGIPTSDATVDTSVDADAVAADSTPNQGDSGSDVGDSSADSGGDGSRCVRPLAATAVLTQAQLGRASSLTGSGNDLYFLWSTFPSVEVSVRKLVNGTGDPVVVQTLLGREYHRVFAVGTSVYYSDKSGSLLAAPDALYRLDPSGTRSLVSSLNGVVNRNAVIGMSLTSDATRLYGSFDLRGGSDADASGTFSVPLGTTAVTPRTTVPGTLGSAFTDNIVAADPAGGYIAVHQDALGSNPATDRQIRVFNPADGYALIGASSAVNISEGSNFGTLAISGSRVFWAESLSSPSRTVLRACTFPSCTPVDVNTEFSGFVFAVDAGRIYFQMRVADDGCGSVGVALASCDLTAAAAGNCVPQVHGIDIRTLGARSIAILGGNAFMASQNGTTYRMAL